MHLGISTGGHYDSEDAGETFEASNHGIGAGFVPDPYPEFGQCVHIIARHDDAPRRRYMQNHGGWEDRPGIGVLRRDDHGKSWYSIADGLPSDFGFPIVVHPDDPDVVDVVPLEPMSRACPDGTPAVYRSQKRGTLLATPQPWDAEKGQFLHSPPRRNGSRLTNRAGALFWNDHGSVVDRP